MKLLKYLISSGFLNISFLSGKIDPPVGDIFLSVFVVGCNYGRIALVLLLKIGAALVVYNKGLLKHSRPPSLEHILVWVYWNILLLWRYFGLELLKYFVSQNIESFWAQNLLTFWTISSFYVNVFILNWLKQFGQKSQTRKFIHKMFQYPHIVYYQRTLLHFFLVKIGSISFFSSSTIF